MKVKGFGAWPSRNVSSGGQKSSFDEYNRSFKGDPYNLAYKKEHYRDSLGYMCRSIEEYNRYPEIKDTTADQDDQNTDAAMTGGALASRSRAARGASRSGAAKGSKSRQVILRQVAGLLVGSVVIVGGYQASLRQRSQPPAEPGPAAVDVEPTQAPSDDVTNPTDQQPTEPSTQPTEPSTQPTEPSTQPATAEPTRGGSSASDPDAGSDTSVSWQWSESGDSSVLVITDSEGNVISEVPASVTTSTTPATCNTDGRITYTASAAANGQSYSDTRYETIAALGHAFDDGTEITLDNGSTAMDFECTRCHEHFTVVNSIDEE